MCLKTLLIFPESCSEREHSKAIYMPVTLKDIAQQTGVSPSVVSTVLSGRDNGTFVSENTRRKVQAVAESLNYTPVRAGRPRGSRRLRRQHTEQFIGVWDPEYSPHTAFLVQSLQVALRDHAQAKGAEAEDDFGLRLLTAEDLPKLDALGIMGLVLLSDSLPPREAAMASIPCVMIGETQHPSRDLVQVHLDGADAGRQMGEYLWDLGHRRLTLLAPDAPARVTQERLDGLRGVWTDREADPAAVTLAVSDTFKTLGEREGVRRAVQSLFKDDADATDARPTVLVCHNENIAAVAAQTLAGMGLVVPQMVSLAGFGDTPRLAEALTPPLTTMRPPAPELARRAVAALYAIHDTPDAARETDVALPGRLMVRGSCAPPPH